MTWVTWRQHRAEGLILLAVLAFIAAFLLITGLSMTNSSQQLGLTNCLAHNTARGSCGDLKQVFANQFGFLFGLVDWLSVLLVLLGLLVGAPLVARELEQRTHLLIWTQSITRWRWLTVKLALVLGVGLLAAGVVMALLIWWYGPIAQFDGRFAPVAFDFSGPVWLAAALLVLALGVFAGTLLRRTILAMFIMLVLFLAIRLPVEFFLRPNYEPAIVVTWPLTQNSPPVTLSNQDWITSSGWLDVQGNQVNHFSCSGKLTPNQCLQADGMRSNYLTYQPADRFWTFQWIETGIYLGFAALALGASVWLVRRRLT